MEDDGAGGSVELLGEKQEAVKGMWVLAAQSVT